jgi:hypothetical protein
MAINKQLRVSEIPGIVKSLEGSLEDIFIGGAYDFNEKTSEKEQLEYIQNLKSRVEKLLSESKHFKSIRGRRITNKLLKDAGYKIEPDTVEYDLLHRKIKKMLAELMDNHIQILLGDISRLLDYYQKTDDNQEDGENPMLDAFDVYGIKKEIELLNRTLPRFLTLADNPNKIDEVKYRMNSIRESLSKELGED